MATFKLVCELCDRLNARRVKCLLIFQICVLLIRLDFVHSNEDFCQGHFKNCTCTDQVVECHYENLPNITVLLPFIKDNVGRVIITHSKFLKLPPNILGSCRQSPSFQLNNLMTLDLSNNSIETIDGQSFHCMPVLETLILSDNVWKIDLKKHQIGYFTKLPNLKHLDLTNSFDEVWNGTIHITKLAVIFNETDMTQLQTLKLSKNEFYSFSTAAANSLCNLTSLKTLDLSYNNLDQPSLPSLDNCLDNLQTLNLSHNIMTVLPFEFMRKIDALKNLKEVRLESNKFHCDCGLIETWLWLNKTKSPLNKYEMTCASGYHSSYVGKPLLSLNLSDLKCVEVRLLSSTAVKVVTSMIFVVIGVTIIAFIITHKKRLGLCVKKIRKRIPNTHFVRHHGYSSVREVAAV